MSIAHEWHHRFQTYVLRDVTSLQTTCPLPDLLDVRPLVFSSLAISSLLPHPDTPKLFLQNPYLTTTATKSMLAYN